MKNNEVDEIIAELNSIKKEIKNWSPKDKNLKVNLTGLSIQIETALSFADITKYFKEEEDFQSFPRGQKEIEEGEKKLEHSVSLIKKNIAMLRPLMQSEMKGYN